MDDPSLDLILSKVVMYKDHPAPGHRFADIFPIFRFPATTKALVNGLVSHIKSTHDISSIHGIVCLEARGWFFAPLIAAALDFPCIPIRRKSKLPGGVVRVSYRKDYEEDAFEMKDDSFLGVGEGRKEVEKVRIILIDDLIAWGGSAEAGKRLVEKLGGEVAERIFVFEIPRLREQVKKNIGETKT
jgi:adenine phosphoribosyltransferase